MLVAILLIYEMRSLVFWLTVSWFAIVLIVDLSYCTHRQAQIFYIPMSIMLAVTCVAGLFVFFNIPERWCEQIRIFQLWMPSHIWFSIAYLVTLYVFLLCLYDLLKYSEEQHEAQSNSVI